MSASFCPQRGERLSLEGELRAKAELDAPAMTTRSPLQPPGPTCGVCASWPWAGGLHILVSRWALLQGGGSKSLVPRCSRCPPALTPPERPEGIERSSHCVRGKAILRTAPREDRAAAVHWAARPHWPRGTQRQAVSWDRCSVLVINKHVHQAGPRRAC